jgi:hypothetical protein
MQTPTFATNPIDLITKFVIKKYHINKEEIYSHLERNVKKETHFGFDIKRKLCFKK